MKTIGMREPISIYDVELCETVETANILLYCGATVLGNMREFFLILPPRQREPRRKYYKMLQDYYTESVAKEIGLKRTHRKELISELRKINKESRRAHSNRLTMKNKPETCKV